MNIYFHQQQANSISDIHLLSNGQIINSKMQLAFEQTQPITINGRESYQQAQFYFKTDLAVTQLQLLIKSNLTAFSARQEYVFLQNGQPTLPIASQFNETE